MTLLKPHDAADVVRSLKKKILAGWEELALANVDAAQAQSQKEFRNSIPKFIDQLIETLASPDPKSQAEKNSSVAKEHGVHRASQEEYSLDEVIYEYHLLRQAIIRALTTEHSLDEDTREIIHEFIDRGIRKAAVEFAERQKFRDNEIKLEREKIERLLLAAVKVAKVGFYDWDIPNDRVSFSEQMKSDWGIAADATLEDVTLSIHPDDRERVRSLIAEAVKNRTAYQAEYRVTHPNRKDTWIEAKGEVSYAKDNTPLKFVGTSIDITERKELEADVALANRIRQLETIVSRDSIELERKKLETILMNSPYGIALWRGENFVYEIVNPEYKKLFKRDCLGKAVFDVFPEAKSQGFPEILRSVLDTGKSFIGREVPFESTSFDSGEPETKFFDLVYVRVDGDDGVPYGIYHSVTEVTERVHSRKKLEAFAQVAETSRLALQDTLESMSDGFFSVDSSWIITHVNSEMIKITGKSESEMIGQNFLDVFFSTTEQKNTVFWQEYNRAMNERVAVSFLDYYAPLDVWTHVRCFPKTEGGIAIFFTDVTAAKTAELALATEREKLESMIELSPIGVALMRSREMIFERVNSRFAELVGPRDYVGKTWREAYPELADSPLVAVMGKVFDTGIPYESGDMPLRIKGNDGQLEDRYYDFSYIRIVDSNQKPYGILLQCRNVTDKVIAQLRTDETSRQLEDAKNEAERANLLKSAFLANMSHEIRTPLGAILGFNDLLRDPGISPGERSNYVNIIARNGSQLSIIIDDILDLSKVEAGHLTLEYTETDHKKIGADVVSLLNVKAREKDLSLEYSSDPSTPETITSDPTRVRQILLNLASNAIKFTKFGSVKIRTYGCHTDDGKKALCFEVSDTGIGLSPSQQGKLFQYFSQADETTTRKFGGTGLGLALSRKLARELGGDITIPHSEENVGTTFLVKIADQPEKQSAPEDRFKVENRSEPELTGKALEGLRILVVDDAPDNQQLIWRYLTRAGAIVESAENGQVGYRFALNGNFDLVLMDIQMPVMDGYTATAKLREAGYRVPIIALTAHAMNDIRKKALNVGYTDHLTKPIDPKSLINAIYKYTRPKH